MLFSHGFIFPRYEFSEVDTRIYDFQQKNLMEKKFLENRIFPISDGLIKGIRSDTHPTVYRT